MPVSVYRGLGFDTATFDTNWKRVYGTVIDNIREGWPVALAIVSPFGSHTVVVDGYDERHDQFHLNLGWEGSPAAWYSLPHVGYYTVITDIIYNLTSSTGTLSGRVTATGGGPVPNAVIHAAPLDLRTFTDSEGHFTLPVPAGRTYTITASYASAPSITRADISVAADGVRSVDFIIEPGERSIVAHYRFDGDGIDASGNNRNLAVDPELVTWETGRYGGAVTVADGDFSGAAPLQSTGYDLLYPGAGDFTVEAWVRFPDSGRNIVLYTDAYAILADQGNLIFQVFDGSKWERVVGHGVLPEREWVHIAGVYRYKAQIAVYVNGSESAVAPTYKVPWVSSGAAYLGILYSDLNPEIYTGLSIDELRISATALPPEAFMGIAAPGVISDTLTDPDADIIRDITVRETTEHTVVLEIDKPSTRADETGAVSFAITVTRQAGSPDHGALFRSYSETVTLDPAVDSEMLVVDGLEPGSPYVITVAQHDDATGEPLTTHVLSAQTFVQFSDDDLDAGDPFITRNDVAQFIADNDSDITFTWSSWDREGAASYSVSVYLDDYSRLVGMHRTDDIRYTIAGMANHTYAVEIKPLNAGGVELGTIRSRFILCLPERVPSPGIPRIAATHP